MQTGFFKNSIQLNGQAMPPGQMRIVQPKLEINTPGDKYEQEADAMADKVMRMANYDATGHSVSSLIGPSVQRKCAECEEEEKKEKPLMRKAESGGYEMRASSSLISSLSSTKGGGSPLPQGTRNFMESAFSADFSRVRVHTDNQASEMSGWINAKAFTYGSDIYFNGGEYAPGSGEGRRLLAHELTHTLQQEREGNIRNKLVQRKDFTPWPGQAGTDVAGTYSASEDIIRERVQRTGDPKYSAPMPSLLEYNTKSCELTSTMNINFIPAAKPAERLSPDQFSKLKSKILEIANSKLNGWVFIHPSGKSCDIPCKDKNISVRIVAQEGSGPDASTVELTKTSSRENAGNLAASSDFETIWHEMGHVVLGAPDEYNEPPRPADKVDESDWSIMANSGSFARRAVMHARHFSHLANWLGRKFPACSFDVIEASVPVVLDYSFLFNMGGFSGSGISGLEFGGEFLTGIPLDQQRRFRAVVGAYGSFILGTSPVDRNAIMNGIITGIRYSPNQSSGHLMLGADIKTGAANFNLGEGSWTPTIGADAKAGYNSPGFSAALSGGVGTPLAGEQEHNPYFHIGLEIGGTF